MAPIRLTLLSMVQMTRPPDAEVHSAMPAAKTSTRNVSASGVITCRNSNILKAGGIYMSLYAWWPLQASFGFALCMIAPHVVSDERCNMADVRKGLQGT